MSLIDTEKDSLGAQKPQTRVKSASLGRSEVHQESGRRVANARKKGAFTFVSGSKSSPMLQGGAGASLSPNSNVKEGELVKHLTGLGEFVRRIRMQARFGDLSRAKLRLLRLQLCGSAAECDWLARPADKWDADLPKPVRDRNISLQALTDAIAVRDLLFRTLPGLCSAAVRVYRQTTGEPLELVITGTLAREQKPPSAVRSLAMRAKLFGLRFWLDDGVLENLQLEEYAVNR